MPNWNDVVAIGRRLPGVEASTWFGTPGLKVAGKGFCRMRTNPDALVIRVLDLGDREALLQGQPEVYFSIPHYSGYPYVLVRLDKVDLTELEELIEDAWRVKAPRRMVAEYDDGGVKGSAPALEQGRPGRRYARASSSRAR